jgi:hypothetical protein
MDTNISPEEHLLNLIKNGKGNIKEVSSEIAKPEIVGATQSQDKALEKKHVFIQVKIKNSKKKSFSFVNKILAVLLFFSLVYAALSFLYPFKEKERMNSATNRAGKETLAENDIAQAQPLSYYSDSVSKRQMFKIFEAPKPKTVEQQKPKITLQQLLGGYTFVGIIFGDVPQAIVEDKKSGQSFYLTSGQMLGDIKINNVEQGRVSVSLGDETMDINI